jgi:D-serine deaminase-like pyridoxal phosphate-dependent protein
LRSRDIINREHAIARLRDADRSPAVGDVLTIVSLLGANV